MSCALENNNTIALSRYAFSAYKAYRAGRLGWDAWKLSNILATVGDDLSDFEESMINAVRRNAERERASSSNTASSSNASDIPSSSSGGSSSPQLPEDPEEKNKKGRSKNHLKPDERAEGDHTVFRSDNNKGVFKYETYKRNHKNPTGFDSSKRVDMTGKSHTNKTTQVDVPTPHVQGKNIPGGVRPASQAEIPSSFKGN